MNMEISKVADKGDIQKERLVFKVVSDVDVGDFELLQTDYIDGELMIHVRHAYWFPYKPVAKGDLVVLYTKSGDENVKTLENGRRVHFFYWGLEKAIWKNKSVAPVLLNAPEWTMRPPDEL